VFFRRFVDEVAQEVVNREAPRLDIRDFLARNTVILRDCPPHVFRSISGLLVVRRRDVLPVVPDRIVDLETETVGGLGHRGYGVRSPRTPITGSNAAFFYPVADASHTRQERARFTASR
jgi:hypothetical protein